jgi:hypothetical protein
MQTHMRVCPGHPWRPLASLLAVAISSSALCAESTNQKSHPTNPPGAVDSSQPTSAKTIDEAATKQTGPAPRPEQIAAWIADLDDNRYLARETATRQLLDAGAASLDDLLAAANGDRPEPADRATWILRRLGNAKDQSLRRQALERMALLQNRPQIAAAAHEALAEIRHNEAVEAIQGLGGRYVTNEYGMAISAYYTPRVVLDQQWRGTDADLALIRDLVAVRQVIIIGTDISLDGLAHLQKVNMLQDLLLYGTKLEPEDVPKVQKLLPHITIDYRRGALLGVGTSPQHDVGPAVVGIVTKGSVAEEAGIKVGDIIHTFENQPVPNFKALTVMIGKHRAGDEVTLVVSRNGQPMEFKIKLGAWETVN